MKKTSLLALALMAGMSASAADNLASGVTVTASSAQSSAALIVDDNTGTRWQAETTTLETDNYFVIDLGSAQTFNSFKMLQEAAYAKGYTISTSSDNTTWTTVVTREAAAITADSDGKYTTTDKLTEAVTAQYVKVQATELAMAYGMSVFEFYVYNVGEQTLATLSVPDADKADASKTICKVGQSVTITALDDSNVEIADGIEWTATSGTVTAAGVFTPSAAGQVTVSATKDGKTATATIYAYDGDNLLLGKTLTCNDGANSINLFTDGNLGTRGGLGNTLPAFATADLGAYYTIGLVDVKQEQACAKDYIIQFSKDGETWTDAYTVTDEKGMDGDVRHYVFGTEGNTDVRFIRFYATSAATNYGISIYEIAAYGTKTADIPDTNAPTGFTATLESTTAMSAKLKLQATDDIATQIVYTITDEANGISKTVTADSGASVDALLSLNPNTTYNLSVTASDGKNTTEPVAIKVETPALPDVPTPTATTTAPIYGTALGNASGYNWYSWGGSSDSGKEITINGDQAYSISTFTYYGSQFSSIDATAYNTIHFDIYPLQDMTIGIVPIINPGTGNLPEKGLQQTLTAGEWNSFDLNLADFGYQSLSGLYQIKYVGGVANKTSDTTADGLANGDGASSFIVGNIYLVGTDVEDTEKPVITTAEATAIGPTTVTLSVCATDNVAGGRLTYTVTDNATDKTLATVSGKEGETQTIKISGLTASTDYVLTVAATDAKGNVSETKDVTFTTKAAGDDTTGSGTASATELSKNGVAYTYTFTEKDGNVTITTTADGTDVIGYVNPTNYTITSPAAVNPEPTGDSYTWEGLGAGTEIRLRLWWGVAGGRSTTDEIVYAVKNGGGSTAISNAAVDGTADDAPTYNLAGQKVGKDYKGVVIRNGKKYLNK